MSKPSGRSSSPIIKKILLPLAALIIVEILILGCSIFGGGLTSHLNQNAKDILAERVINRKNYLQTEMVNTWSQLDLAVQAINTKATELAAAGEISFETLDDSSEACLPLILAVEEDLISLMRTNRTTGAFVVFNNDDLSRSQAAGTYENKPGLYFRDLDPVSAPSYRNMDLLICLLYTSPSPRDS